MFDVNALRKQFPSLSRMSAATSRLPIFLDGPGGTQVPQRVIDERGFRAVTLVGVVVQQMIVAWDAVIDGVRGVKLKTFFKVSSAKFRELGHSM